MNETLKNNLDSLVAQLSEVSRLFTDHAGKQVNVALTLRNWMLGFLIAEYELNGEDRAKYGDKIYQELANRLGKGFSKRSLYLYFLFYKKYPQIVQTVSAQLQLPDFNENLIFRTLSGKLRGLPSKDDGRSNLLDFKKLLNRLSFSHFIELINLEPELKRNFYEMEALKNEWAVRDLKRAINSMLYERTGLSKDKSAFLEKQISSLKPEPEDVIRNPYILEFLGLEEKESYSESDLEQAIIDNLQKFLLEAGRGFCFEARQKRITFDNTHYRIDLVFYHRILKCHVLIDLKLGEFTHVDAGQMNVFLNYFKEEECSEGDNSPIGLILCAGKNETLVKYATGGLSEHIFVSKYMIRLPKEDELRKIVEMGRRDYE